MAKRRVVVWGTGSIGMPGLRNLIGHPDYELVGLHAWPSHKIGRDAGYRRLCDAEPGIVRQLDLPHFYSKNVRAPDFGYAALIA